MKVLFDTSALGITKAGVSNYVVELMAAIRKHKPAFSVEELAYKPIFSRKTPFRVVDSFYRDTIWHSTKLAGHARKIAADLVHAPAFHFPLFYNGPMLVTIHDLYAYEQPADLRLWHGGLVRRYIAAAVNKGHHILVLSEFTRSEILKYFPKANPERIHVVYSGIPTCRAPLHDFAFNTKVMQQLKAEGPYLLSVSTIEPRKNFFNLIRAFASIAETIEHKLILVGQNGWHNEKVYDLISRLNLQDRVFFTGYVSDKVLNNLYTHADAFVFPSLYEGFGFTPLEAMKCNCPVISSDASCMPEILGDAALYFKPDDLQSMAQAMLKVVSDQQLKGKMCTAGVLHAAKYTWQSTAQQTIAVYRKVLEDSA